MHQDMPDTTDGKLTMPNPPEWSETNPFKPKPIFHMDMTGIEADTVCGLMFVGDIKPKFYSITCPCGVTDSYPLNGLPEVDTPQSCGKPNHWFIMYKEQGYDSKG